MPEANQATELRRRIAVLQQAVIDLEPESRLGWINAIMVVNMIKARIRALEVSITVF